MLYKAVLYKEFIFFFRTGQQHLLDVSLSSSEQYDSHLKDLFSKSESLDNANFNDCKENKGLGYYIPESAQ